MAAELTLGISAVFSKSGAAISKVFSGLGIDVTASVYTSLVQTVGTSEESVGIGDVATIGYVWAKNLDATNYVELFSATTDKVAKLKPGEACILRWATGAIIAKANTAACNVEFVILSD